MALFCVVFCCAIFNRAIMLDLNKQKPKLRQHIYLFLLNLSRRRLTSLIRGLMFVHQ